MALGTATLGNRTGEKPGAPTFFIPLSFAGDGAYAAGGTAAFQAYVRAAVSGAQVEVLTIIPGDCGGFIPVYVKSTDKLKLYTGDNDAGADGPLAEAANGSYAATTFNIVVVAR